MDPRSGVSLAVLGRDRAGAGEGDVASLSGPGGGLTAVQVSGQAATRFTTAGTKRAARDLDGRIEAAMVQAWNFNCRRTSTKRLL